MGLETEAAFEVRDRDTARRLRGIEALAGMTVDAARIRKIRDTYLDTTRRALHRAGWALRRREESGRITLELKSLDAPRDWIRRRREIAIEIAGLAPPEEWPAGELRQTVERIRGDAPLVALFAIRQLRLARTVRRGQAAVVELCLDKIRISAAGRIEQHRVLEIERLPSARPQDLPALVAALRGFPGLAPAASSKYERGLALARRRRRRPPAGRDPIVMTAQRDLAVEDVLAALRDLGYGVTVTRTSDTSCEEAFLPGCRVTDVQVLVRGPDAQSRRLRVRSWLFMPAFDEAMPARTLSVSIDRSGGDGARYLAGLLAERLPLERRREDPTAGGPGEPEGPVAGDTAAQAGAKVLRARARELRAHLDGARRGDDPEHVHQLRVACRRARFAFKVFDGMTGPGPTAATRAELAWIAALLGEVRDLDVLLARLGGDLDRAGADTRFGALLRTALEGRRGVAAARLQEALDSPRFLDLLAALERSEAVPAGGVDPVPAARFARRAVHRAAARLAAAASRLEGIDANGLHRIRILSKRLRYTAEFFAPLDERAARPLVRAGTKFQRVLGASQDAAVGERLLRALLAERLDLAGDPGFALTLGALLQVQREELAQAAGRFPRLWASRGGAVRKAAT